MPTVEVKFWWAEKIAHPTWLNRSRNLLDIALNQLSLGRASLQQAIAVDPMVGRVSDSVTRQSPDSVVLRCANTTYDYHALTTTELQTLNKAMQSAESWLNQAVEGLRKAGVEGYLSRGLLARASYHRYTLSFNHNVAQMELTKSGEPHSLDQASPHSAEQDADYTSALQDLQEAHDIAQRDGMRLHLTDYHLESARLLFTVEPPNFKQSAADHIAAVKQLIADTGYNRRLPELTSLEQILETIQEAVRD